MWASYHHSVPITMPSSKYLCVGHSQPFPLLKVTLSTLKELKTVLPGHHVLFNTGMPKEKEKNWLATFEMLPSSDPTGIVIAMVSGQAVWAFVASQRATTVLFIHSPGLRRSPLGCSLSGRAVSRALLFLIKEKQGNSHAPHFSVWMLRLSLTQACMAPSLEPEARPNWLYKFTCDFNPK